MEAVVEIKKDERWYVEWNLENWARWMGNGGTPRGLPDRASGGALSNYTTLDANNERAYEQLDADLAKRTNAVVDDLVPVEKNAIYKAYGLIALVQIIHFDAVLATAKLKVTAGLRRKGVWLGS
jgi:hypothetical protein